MATATPSVPLDALPPRHRCLAPSAAPAASATPPLLPQALRRTQRRLKGCRWVRRRPHSPQQRRPTEAKRLELGEPAGGDPPQRQHWVAAARQGACELVAVGEGGGIACRGVGWGWGWGAVEVRLGGVSGATGGGGAERPAAAASPAPWGAPLAVQCRRAWRRVVRHPGGGPGSQQPVVQWVGGRAQHPMPAGAAVRWPHAAAKGQGPPKVSPVSWQVALPVLEMES